MAADRGRFERELATLRSYAARRERSYATPRAHAAACDGGVRVADPAGDPVANSRPAQGAPPQPAGADLREVRVAEDGPRVCVRFTLAAQARRPLALTFNLRDSLAGTGFIQTFTADLRADGRARVTSGEDEQRHPIPVPAQVAADGSVVSMVLDAAAFAAGRPSPMSGRERPRGRFAFTAYALARTGERDSVRDDLGTWSYPDGARLGA